MNEEEVRIAKETLEALFSDSTGEDYPYTEKFGQAVNTAIQALEEVEQYRALGTVEELKEAREFKKYFDELYGEGLEIANWHKNGDLEPFDSFYESALKWSEEDD